MTNRDMAADILKRRTGRTMADFEVLYIAMEEYANAREKQEQARSQNIHHYQDRYQTGFILFTLMIILALTFIFEPGLNFMRLMPAGRAIIAYGGIVIAASLFAGGIGRMFGTRMYHYQDYKLRKR